MNSFMNEFMNVFMEEMSPEAAEFFTLYLISYGLSMLMTSIFGVISYILSSISLFTVAKRRGIEKPWLAWIPVGNEWILGCISDQYRYVAHGQVKNRRKTMVTLSIIVLIMCFVVLLLCGIVTATTLIQFNAMTESSAAGMLIPTLGMILLSYAMLALCIILMVNQYIAWYDYFRSCEPKRTLLYFLLSILLSFPMPFLVFACRNKDLGMPPKQETQELPTSEF